MKKIIAVLVLLILGGAGWYGYHRYTAGPGVTFRTAEIATGEMVPTISATGIIEPQDAIDVGAQVGGKILSFGPDPDDIKKPIDYRSRVTANMLLANIDPTLVKAELESAEATLAAANAMAESASANKALYVAQQINVADAWKRAQKVHPTTAMGAVVGAVVGAAPPPSEAMSENDYQTARAAYEVANANLLLGDAKIREAKANVDQAMAQKKKSEKNLEYCTIVSPVDGVIIDRRVNVGQTVVSSLNAPSLFLIAKDLKNVQVWVSVNEADIKKVYVNQPVTFTVDALPGETFDGRVQRVRLNANLTQNVVTYTVEVSTQNADLKLFPYMTANVQFEIARHKNATLVSNAALRWFPLPEMVAPDVKDAMAAEKAKAAPEAAPAGGKAKGGKKSRPESGPASQPTAGEANPEPHGRGTVWIIDGKFVRPVKVRTGFTDGVNTEISFMDKATALSEKAQVVVGVVRPQEADSGTTNPFAPQAGEEGDVDGPPPADSRMDVHSRPSANFREILMELITLNNLYKTYHVGEIDVPVLKGISLSVGRGEMVALMGASGSGKSTLMNILGCLDRPTSGDYWLDGEEVSRLTNDERATVRNHKIGFVFQSFNLLPRTSAIEQVMMPLTYTNRSISDREARQRAEKLLKRVGLEDRLDHEPSQLSGGQQQRVAIARALINHPPLLFADEPTGNLDSRTSVEVLKMFEQLNADEGITIILVTHDANVAKHSKRTIRISDGLIESGAYADEGASRVFEVPTNGKAVQAMAPGLVAK